MRKNSKPDNKIRRPRIVFLICTTMAVVSFNESLDGRADVILIKVILIKVMPIKVMPIKVFVFRPC